ncbi:hypothetical protein [Streptomyces iakyrus]
MNESGASPAAGENPADMRRSGLSAWGTFLAGLAAVMTFFTAVATSYVAVATYQDQKEKDAEKKEIAAFDFAQKVEFAPTGEGGYTVDNPNDFPLSDVVVFSFWKTQRPTVSWALSSQDFLLPACTRVTFRDPMLWKVVKDGWKLPKDATPHGRAAYFKDRTGQPWLSEGSDAFRRSEIIGSDFWAWAERSGMTMWWYTPDSVDGYRFMPSEMGAVFTKSPRCD